MSERFDITYMLDVEGLKLYHFEGVSSNRKESEYLHSLENI